MPRVATQGRGGAAPPRVEEAAAGTAAGFLAARPPGPYTAALARRGGRPGGAGDPTDVGGGSGAAEIRVLGWGRHAARLAASAEALAAAGLWSPVPGGWAEAAAAWARAPLAAALRAELAAAPAAREACAVVLLLPPAGDAGAGDECAVYAAALPEGRGLPAPTACTVLEHRRAVPRAKGSAWVTARRGLEARKEGAEPGHEVLMVSPDGLALEGLVTNFFATAPPDGGGGKRGDGRRVLRTAPVEAGVLPGVARQALLEVCEAAGVEVREEAPDVAGAAGWEAGLLTNCIRLLQPVRKLYRRGADGRVGEIELAGGAEPWPAWLRDLRARLDARLDAEALVIPESA